MITQEMGYLFIICIIALILVGIHLAKTLKTTKMDKEQEEIRRNWNNHYYQQEQIRMKEIQEDPYYALNPEEKEQSRKIKIDHTQPTFEEWKEAKARNEKK